MKHGLFVRSFCRNLRVNPDITILLCLGLTISIYTVCTLLGAAMGEYRLALQGNDTATLTVDILKEAFDPDQWDGALPEEIPGGTVNTIYISQLSAGQYVIGWDGNDPQMWFPGVYGRFFMEDEQRNAAEVIYSSEQVSAEEQMISLEGRIYQLIGKGSLVFATFGVATSRQSKHADFWYDYTGEYEFFVLPYRTYLKEYTPDLVLIQLAKATPDNLKNAQTNLMEDISGVQVYLPDVTAAQVLIKSNVKYALLSIGLSLLALMSIVMISREWIGQLEEEISVYHLCGLSGRRCILHIYTQYLILYLICTGAALLIHAFSRSVLEFIYADASPNLLSFVLVLILLFFFVVLCTVGHAEKLLRAIQRRDD